MSLFETTFALQRCSVTEMIDSHFILQSVSFRLPSSSLALFASLFKYLCMYVCLLVCLSDCLSVCLSVCMSVYQSVCLFVCLATKKSSVS